MLFTKVVLVALVSVIVVCGYPIHGPSDAPDQTFRVGNYGEYIRNLEKKQRFSYNEIDESLQPVLEDDDDVELSLLAQPVSQPPSEDTLVGSNSRPIVPSKHSSDEVDLSSESDEHHDGFSSSESGKDEKGSSSESAEDSRVSLESNNKKQEEAKQDPELMKHEKEPVADVASPVVDQDAGSEIAIGLDVVTESPQVQDENYDAVSHVAQPEEEKVVPFVASDNSAPATDFPVAFVSQDEPKEVAQEQAVSAGSGANLAQPEQEQNVALAASEDSTPITDFHAAFVSQDEPKEVPQAESDGSGALSTNSPVQFDENPVVVLDETATSISVSDSDEGSGSLVADAVVTEEEKEIVAHADGLEGAGLAVADAVPEVGIVASDDLNEEGSGLALADPLPEVGIVASDGASEEGSGQAVADALPEVGIVASDGLSEEGSGFLTADAANDEGSGLSVATEELHSDALPEEGSGLTDDIKVESPEGLRVSEQVGPTLLPEADGSGESAADEESTIGPSVENDEASGASPDVPVSEMDHQEPSDDSPIREEAQGEKVADDSIKFIPVEVVLDTESQSNTEEKVNEPETTETTLKVETGAHQSDETAALSATLPEAAVTETVEQDQPSEVEKLSKPATEQIADVKISSEQPQRLMQSDDFIPAATGSQRPSRLF